MAFAYALPTLRQMLARVEVAMQTTLKTEPEYYTTIQSAHQATTELATILATGFLRLRKRGGLHSAGQNMPVSAPESISERLSDLPSLSAENTAPFRDG